ncbi:hypothetical protein O6H91_13G038600 [Diphasiastrum complanatum]|uniref:Uncharacterized protein n=1 Tax=Diphasiastrum complanatum TaxID=34168 RepID=A0ACC2BTZ4_DIPCM|nr:hypothetical protein O6H91_13G038600 [Diphasiastrum complanatum]
MGRLQKLPIVLQYASLFAHLATFGIIGVLIRYGLEELFGPMVVGMTQNTSALFSSLPPNMVGCFFMGWVGIVWKKEITHFSEHLALGLSTGLMGSITTFASWNQELLNAITAGYWVRGLCGFLIGMELAQMSLQVGIDTAKGLQSAINSIQSSRVEKGLARIPKPAAESLERRQLSLFLFLVSSAVLWVLTSILVAKDAHSFNRRKLWLACVLAPPGVWTRWFLSHYNGRGIGRKRWLKWLPIGTFATNIIASNIECLLSLINLKVHNYSSALTVGALQLGLLGCMSTVSTLVTEVCFLHQGENHWRAYMYTILTMFSALITGIILYSICVWVDDYKVL